MKEVNCIEDVKPGDRVVTSKGRVHIVLYAGMIPWNRHRDLSVSNPVPCIEVEVGIIEKQRGGGLFNIALAKLRKVES